MTAQVTRIPRAKRAGFSMNLEQIYEAVHRPCAVLQFPGRRMTADRAEAFICKHFDFVPAERRATLAEQLCALENGANDLANVEPIARKLHGFMKKQGLS